MLEICPLSIGYIVFSGVRRAHGVQVKSLSVGQTVICNQHCKRFINFSIIDFCNMCSSHSCCKNRKNLTTLDLLVIICRIFRRH